MDSKKVRKIYSDPNIKLTKEDLAYRQGYLSEYPYNNPYPKHTVLYNFWEAGLCQCLNDEYESFEEEEQDD